jgi:hypothetical protein
MVYTNYRAKLAEARIVNETITLYHGTVYDFDEIDLSRGKPFKDFGRGFYTTKSRSHAISMAARNREILRHRLQEANIKSDVITWLYTYEFSAKALNQLSVKEFAEPTREWMLFVGANRTHEEPQHSYDVVIGPTANDRTNLSIKTYFFGGYGDVGSDNAIDFLLQIVKPYELPPQMFFRTERAARLLTRTGRERIR